MQADPSINHQYVRLSVPAILEEFGNYCQTTCPIPTGFACRLLLLSPAFGLFTTLKMRHNFVTLPFHLWCRGRRIIQFLYIFLIFVIGDGDKASPAQIAIAYIHFSAICLCAPHRRLCGVCPTFLASLSVRPSVRQGETAAINNCMLLNDLIWEITAMLKQIKRLYSARLATKQRRLGWTPFGLVRVRRSFTVVKENNVISFEEQLTQYQKNLLFKP